MNLESTRRVTGLLCVAMTLGFLIVGLWPFAFRPTNEVHWIRDGSGLRFEPPGIAYDPEPLPTTGRHPSAAAPASVTVELWVEPELEPHTDVHDILTIFDRRLPSSFVLCQWKKEMLLRVPGKTKRGFRETGVSRALEAHSTRLITLTCDPEGTSWYFDGTPVKSSPGFTLPADALSGRLVVGDSPAGKHAWSGRMYGLAIYDRTLGADEVLKDYRAWTNHQAMDLTDEPGLITLLPFDEGKGRQIHDRSSHHHALSIPQAYRTLYKTVLAWPADPEELFTRDTLINLLGFMPFGFVFYWHRRSGGAATWPLTAGLAVLVGSMISLVIEVTQIWLPNRDSSALDLACNILGTLLGAALAASLWRKLRQR